MGSAAKSTAVTHLTSVGRRYRSATRRRRPAPTEAASAATAPRAGTSPAERAGVAGVGRSGADAPRTGGCACLSFSAVRSRLLPGHRASGRASRQSRGLRAAGATGEAGEPLAREWRCWIPGRRENRGDGARLGRSGHAAPVPSRFRPFWVTSTPLSRPHLSGAASTAPRGRGGGGDTARADWAVAAAVVRPRKRRAPGTPRPRGPGLRQRWTSVSGVGGDRRSHRGHVSRVGWGSPRERTPPAPPLARGRPNLPGRFSERHGRPLGRSRGLECRPRPSARQPAGSGAPGGATAGCRRPGAFPSLPPPRTNELVSYRTVRGREILRAVARSP